VFSSMAAASGLPIVFPAEDGRYDAAMTVERTMACVHAADSALGLAVDTPVKGSRRRLARLLPRVQTDTGPAAVLLMAHGLSRRSGSRGTT
jgi:hypothetical protein